MLGPQCRLRAAGLACQEGAAVPCFGGAALRLFVCTGSVSARCPFGQTCFDRRCTHLKARLYFVGSSPGPDHRLVVEGIQSCLMPLKPRQGCQQQCPVQLCAGNVWAAAWLGAIQGSAPTLTRTTHLMRCITTSDATCMHSYCAFLIYSWSFVC